MPCSFRRALSTRPPPTLDTYRIVKTLEGAQFTRPQAIALMRLLETLLSEGSAAVRRQSVSRTDLDSAAFKFRSRLHELREELRLAGVSGSAELRAEIAELQNRIDAVSSKLDESLATLRFELSVEQAARKSEESESLKAVQARTLELGQRLGVELADLRTASETSKMRSTRRLVGIVVGGLLATMGLDWVIPKLTGEREANSKDLGSTTMPKDSADDVP